MLEVEDKYPVDSIESGHVVHFYEDDDSLAQLAGAYLAAALLAGGAAVSIATASHTRMILEAIAETGVDVRQAELGGQLWTLDADESIARIAPGGRMAPDEFATLIGGVIREAGRDGRQIRAYGEMVARLWESGHVGCAIDLEQHWNDLAAESPFGLFCAYSMDSMVDGQHDDFEHVCRLHSDVLECAPMPVAEASRRFTSSLAAAGLARRYVKARLEEWGCSRLIDDAVIAVSELAANAVQYGGTDFTVGLDRAGHRLRLSVGDPSVEPPALGSPGPFASGGRGLPMIARLSSAWGHQRVDGGKIVWLDLPA